VSTADYPDIKVHTKDRQLKVVTKWSAPRNAWYVSIEDDTYNNLYKNMYVGAWLIGGTAQWCYNADEVAKARTLAERDAQNGRLV
jgi:hypothetical protein